MMHSERVMVDHIDTPSRLRGVSADKVKQLAESMDAIGLQTPITLHQETPDQGGFDLVAGAHRLNAAKLLGWEWIDAVFTDADEIDRQLWEIDENLIRSELTLTQQAEHLVKRQELWGMREVSGQIDPKPQGGRPKGFAQETSDATGMDKRSINRAISRAKGVTEEARDAIRGTDLDKGVVLDELKKVAPEEQMDRLQMFRTQREHVSEYSPEQKMMQALWKAWREASEDVRRRFIEEVDSPIMDRNFG